MKRDKKRWMAALAYLLIGINVAVGLLVIGFSPHVQGGYSYFSGDPVSYLANSRDLWRFPWVLGASFALSVGVYLFFWIVLDDGPPPS
jgi:hypothetical protein